MAVLLDVLRRCRAAAPAFQAVADELLGAGLPAPRDAIAAAGFVPDRPWSWCVACGGRVELAADTTAPGRVAGALPGCGPLRCRSASYPGRPDAVVRLGAHDGALRPWVVDVKHAAWEAMGEELGAMLAAQMLRCGVVACGDAGAIVVPVPSPWLRTRSRGIDHARCIAEAVAGVLRVPCRAVLAQRLGGTQVGSGARDDRVSRRARFRARGRAAKVVAGHHVVLVDDVRTTGATLAEASAALRACGASRITGAVVSVKE